METTILHPNGTFAVELGVMLNDEDVTGTTEKYRRGYWVALTHNVVTDQLQFDLTVENLIENNYDLIGVWYDDEKDVTNVDGTRHVEDLIQAVMLGRVNNQKAIWDIKHNREIFI